MSKYLAVAKINFKKGTWVAYLCTGICFLMLIVDYILDFIFQNSDNSTISLHCMLYLICIMSPVFIASSNYTKFMNLGIKKKTYFFGCIINYIVFAFIISLLGVIEYYFTGSHPLTQYDEVYNLISVFGWGTSVFNAFFSQFTFLLLVQSIIHTLTFVQAKWYGLIFDALIIAIISVFTPIPVLRQAEVFFFKLTIFQNPAIIHISISLILSMLIYSTNLLYLKNRKQN